MDKIETTRRQVLMGIAGAALATAVPSRAARAAAPEPTVITPALIEAA